MMKVVLQEQKHIVKSRSQEGTGVFVKLITATVQIWTGTSEMLRKGAETAVVAETAREPRLHPRRWHAD